MLNAYAVHREVAIERFLLGGQLAIAGFLEWNKAVTMYGVYGIVSFIRYIKNIIMCVNPASLEQRKIVCRAFGFMRTQYLAVLPIDNYLIFDGMTLLLT